MQRHQEGLHLPSNFHLVIPAAFVSWGMFFALGADNAALRSTALNCLIGSVLALILFVFVDIVKGVPDFWATRSASPSWHSSSSR